MRLQIEGFKKALSKGGGANKFLRFMSRKKEVNGTASADTITLDDMLTFSPVRVRSCYPASMVATRRALMFARRLVCVYHLSARIPVQCAYMQDLIPTSLLKLNSEHTTRAIKMFAGTLKYMGETSEEVTFETAIEIAQKLLHQAIKRPDLKDELYMHLIKQTRGNPNLKTKLKAWELFFLVASTVPPSKLYIGLVSEYIHSLANDEAEHDDLRQVAEATWRSLKRSAKAGARHTLPSFEEIDAALKGQSLQTIVFFLDETFEELKYDITTTVLEAVEQLASIIKLQHYTTFTLFECRKLTERAAAEPVQDEHVLLDDHKYIADVLYEIRTSARAGKETYSSRLLFKKRMFRETDETVTETVFVNLSYVQAQFDYLQGNYPVVRDDASQMCALQIQAESGPTLIDQEEPIFGFIDKYAACLLGCSTTACMHQLHVVHAIVQGCL